MRYETGLYRPVRIETLTPHTAGPTVEALLGPDYERAVRTNLLDCFAVSDGAIQHILCGEIKEIDANGAAVVGGFHHLPSAQHAEGTGEIWPDETNDPASGDDTRPYATLVMIQGHLKKSLRRAPQSRHTIQVPTLNSMFPRALSPLEVLEMIRQAYFSRNRASEVIEGPNRVVSLGVAPETERSSAMAIKIVWDLLSEKIISAVPELPAEEKARVRHMYNWQQIVPAAGRIALRGPGRYRTVRHANTGQNR